MSDKAICPKCHKPYVYSEHKDDRWRIHCIACGLTTKIHSTYKLANKEWNDLEEQGENT